ncbi:hypothetical protein K9M74_04915 [Candidatus Woesearchaeota archaeon]|nr:hypothetical protein [Candidatus Woesearchaeota archaeon]
MKYMLPFLLFFLLVSFASALESDYAYMVTTGEEIQLTQGTIYLVYPDEVVDDELFLIEVLFYPNVSESRFLLFREDKPLLSETTGPEPGEDTSYFYLSWADSLRMQGSYEFDFLVNNSLIYQDTLFISVLPKPLAFQLQQEPVLIKHVVDEELLSVTYTLLSDAALTNFTKEELLKANQLAEATTIVNKSYTHQENTYEDGTTREETVITIHIQPTQELKSLDIIEHIPKGFTSRAAYLFANKPFTILQEDPVIMWHVEDVTEPVELTYAIDKTTDITGNTILLAQKANDTTNSFINWKLAGPLVIIPLIALLIIYSERFFSKTKKNISSSKKPSSSQRKK